MGNIFAIGDIHGCLDKLRALLDNIDADIDVETDTLVFLGDYIDRGRKSYEVVDYLIDVKTRYRNCIFLKGNHEEMLEKYPDAYATAKVIGERAVRSAFRRNTAAAEEYYDMLRQNDKFASVTTERGMEVMPNVEHYLAQQYLRDGRMEEARALRDSLELNFTGSYILTRDPGTGWKWLPVSQVVSKLDQQLK